MIVHALLHIARMDVPVTSEELAPRMNTHPVVMRRAMGGLREAGIVRAQKGHGGGFTLARALDDTFFQLDNAQDRDGDLFLGHGDCLIDKGTRDFETIHADLRNREAVGQRWTQREIVAHFADLVPRVPAPSLALVNKVVQHLRDQAFLEQLPNRGFRVRDFEGLLQAWRVPRCTRQSPAHSSTSPSSSTAQISPESTIA